ncbi:conserved exported hypothetical protein [Rubrivivax sp. A210]|uniref:hypothetical protein n=1 Tax=Rubrivivax sp. A210 TaxID=2772301 RepID=UPI001918090D|nr:hypothetical protein [Rubrivivax sp. A210]CAD5374162.1 conserved exported hypothetical protein [Rubrivivax sp. A210]
MNRCIPSALAALAVWAAPAAAQLSRNFPADALRGEIVVTAPPEILLNQQPARLAPGARIRGSDNLLLLSGALLGQRLLVNYSFDTLGLVREVWLLNADEAARTPWPVSVEQAQSWSFDPASQTWTRP